MQRLYVTLLFIVAIMPSLVANAMVSSGRASQSGQNRIFVSAADRPEPINIDGDLSMSEQEDLSYWNPHSVGLTNASNWHVTFTEEAGIFLRTGSDETGHVALGSWWTTSFKSKEKIHLYETDRTHILASFRLKIDNAQCDSGHEWLRIALACAIERSDHSVVYTEMDLWDSPDVLTCSSGNIMFGGNLVYKGGDVVEYKVNQTAIGVWTTYLLDLTDYISSAWSPKSGDALESVYLVVEAAGAVTVTLRVDDLWIACVR